VAERNPKDRIVVLKRYIALLQLEEKRLKWVSASASSPSGNRADAERDLSALAEKLRKAEQELGRLEAGERRPTDHK
jgi:hypothetical protein